MTELSDAELMHRWGALPHEEREVYIKRAMAILQERDAQRGGVLDRAKETASLAFNLWAEDQRRAAHQE